MSTGIFILPVYWSNGMVSHQEPMHEIHNKCLLALRLEIGKKELLIHMNTGHMPMPWELKEMVQERPCTRRSFLEILNSFIGKSEALVPVRIRSSTFNTYKIRQKILQGFLMHLRKTHLMPEQFTPHIATLLFDYLTVVKKNSRNYAGRVIAFAARVLKFAIRERELQTNPLEFYSIKRDPPKPIVALNVDELIKLERHRFRQLRLQYVADNFLFQCYEGLCYADLVLFNPDKHLQERHDMKWIMMNRHKSGTGTIVPLFQEARLILEKYAYQLPVITNQKYNSYLKEIGEICGIEKNLTTHMARKTFANIRLNGGYTIEAVSRMMGHKNISMTQSHYANPGIDRILLEYRKMAG